MNPHHHRRSIRLRGYDYSQAGAYFVTLCIHARECLLGCIKGGVVELSGAGKAVSDCWQAIPTHFPNVTLDEWVVMPNHIHGILCINASSGATHALSQPSAAPLTPGPRPASVGAIVGSFKSAAARGVNRLRNTPGMALWQRNYYEHIIRDEAALRGIRQYIADNPGRWDQDQENPARVQGNHDVGLESQTPREERAPQGRRTT